MVVAAAGHVLFDIDNQAIILSNFGIGSKLIFYVLDIVLNIILNVS